MKTAIILNGHDLNLYLRPETKSWCGEDLPTVILDERKRAGSGIGCYAGREAVKSASPSLCHELFLDELHGDLQAGTATCRFRFRAPPELGLSGRPGGRTKRLASNASS